MGDCVEGNFLNKSLPKAPFELPSFTTIGLKGNYNGAVEKTKND